MGGISCKAGFGTPGAAERCGLREALGGRIGDRSGRLKLSRQGGGENVRADRDAGWRAFLGGVKPEGWGWHSWRRGVRRIRIGGDSAASCERLGASRRYPKPFWPKAQPFWSSNSQKTARNSHAQPETARNSQKQPETAMNSQKQQGTARNSQNIDRSSQEQPENSQEQPENSQEQPETARHSQNIARNSQGQPALARNSQRQPGTARNSQEQPENS